MKKQRISLFFAIFLLTLSAPPLTGCGRQTPENTSIPKAEDAPAPFSHAVPQALSDAECAFPDAASFIDDTGKSMQRDGAYLYGYYNGRLLRFQTETEACDLLYQTASTHAVSFCLSGDFIYFVERTGYDSPDDRDTFLYRMEKDGGNLTLLQEDIPNASSVQYAEQYQIDLYDDIIYLINYIGEYEDGNYVTKSANLYYRLENDGLVTEADESETLYGMLPVRFSPICDRDFPTLPYAMRNYGYLFAQDFGQTVYRIDPASGANESLGFHAAASFSGDLVLLQSYSSDTPYLFRLSDQTFIPVEDSLSSYSVAFPTEQGFFCINILYEDVSGDYVPTLYLCHILPDGSVETLLSEPFSSFPDNLGDIDILRRSSFFDDYFYYFISDEAQRRLMRFSAQDVSTSQILDAWPAFPAASPAVLTAEEQNTETKIGNTSVSRSVKLIYLEEQTGADRLINEQLTEVYADFDCYIEDIIHIQEEQEEFDNDPALYDGSDYVSGHDFSLYASCDYMDDDTISFCLSYYQYFAHAAHGYYWSDYYVFDRRTGARLSFEDFVGDAAAILETAFPYVEKEAGWDFDKEILLDVSRFSLSEDGYTLYFAPYEIDCYAAGSFLITIPYEAFEKMKTVNDWHFARG